MITNIINVAELAGKNWDFIERFYSQPKTPEAPAIAWKYYSGVANNLIERCITRPKISRYRACLQATCAIANNRDIVISHLPRTSHWQSVFMRLSGKKNPHLAFAFNFTDLPQGKMHHAMKKSFRHIDHFVVYSEYERKKYADYFEIPIEKIHMLHWAMETPKTDNAYTPPHQQYYCAVGGEGRDYKTLINTFRLLPEQHLTIVTRPNTIHVTDIPNNVTVFYNLPSQHFWRIVEKSKAVIVPLINEDTACGHITLVGAMRLGKAIITTQSQGTSDYVIDNYNGLIVESNNCNAIKNAVLQFESDPALINTLSQNSIAFTQKHCEPTLWANHIEAFINDHTNHK